MDKTRRQDCNPLMKVGQVYITKSMEGAPFKIGKYSMHTSFDHLQIQNTNTKLMGGSLEMLQLSQENFSLDKAVLLAARRPSKLLESFANKLLYWT